jgi:hypothetical protein
MLDPAEQSNLSESFFLCGIESRHFSVIGDSIPATRKLSDGNWIFLFHDSPLKIFAS